MLKINSIEINILANLIAMLQLQEKFKNVLDKMADLTDEKQQLEHLVMQLQSETETIGIYRYLNLRIFSSNFYFLNCLYILLLPI